MAALFPCRFCRETRCRPGNKNMVCRASNCQAALKREQYAADPSPWVRWADRNPARIMLSAARTRAKNQGVPCTITLEDLDAAWTDTCPILGIPLKKNRGKLSFDSPSLDKIKPELGYVPGNIQVISHRANVMKNDASPDELLRFAAWIQAAYGSEKVT